MACNSPLVYYDKKKGKYNHYPCRWCMGCRIDRRNTWLQRIRYECYLTYRRGSSCSFNTLTYSDEELKDLSLHPKDITDFNKRLRRYIEYHNYDLHFKFYLSGVYGSDLYTSRPHYHAIYCGLSVEQFQDFSRKLWYNSIVDSRPVSSGRIRYTLKYIEKQLRGKDAKNEYDDKNRCPCFSQMSKGIGSNYYLLHYNELLNNGVINNAGHYISIPSYWSKKYNFDNEVIKLSNHNSFLYNFKESHYNNIQEYQNFLNFSRELKLVTEARLSGSSVDDIYLSCARSKLPRHNEDYINNLVNLANDSDDSELNNIEEALT